MGAPHVGGAPHSAAPHYAAPHYATPHYGTNYGSRTIAVGGLGYGYGGLGYGGLGYGYGGLGYGGGYGGGYGSGYGGSLAVPSVPGTYSALYPPGYQTEQLLPMRDPNTEPTPLPLPGGNAAPAGNAGSGEATAAKITVITNEGAKVSFEGIESDQTGTRHSFTTKPLSTSGEVRVKVTVDGSTITVSVRGGEKATIDMRK